MKSVLSYTIKVGLTTLLIPVPLTLAIGLTYIKYMTITATRSWSFNFNVKYVDTIVLTLIFGVTLFFTTRHVLKLGLSNRDMKIRIALRTTSLTLFIFAFYYLVVSAPDTVTNFLLTIVPTVIIGLLSIWFYKLRPVIVDEQAEVESAIDHSL
ncbi:hypothetical protein GCM10023149_52050 [Mucilaginibacter gynuensis]|uniref:DUF2975 domain-containing protein n=1 Tax=Mucilaginibacter gynuensis TaxID=1302236 RepID=A0ABP8HKC5_9SPHI